MSRFEHIIEAGREFVTALCALFRKSRFAPTRRNVWSF
jgi:hypothetical protein